MKNKQAKTNKKIEKEKKLVQEIVSEYSETFKALGEYDKKELKKLA